MKCPECGNINVETKETREDGVAYECKPCEKGFVYDNGLSAQVEIQE